MKTIMCFGTFDLLHLGHIDYFRQAKQHADKLIVVVARDGTKKQQKKMTVFGELERLKLIQELKLVGQAVLGNVGDHFKIIETIKPDVILLGYDHPITEENLQKELAARNLFPVILRARPYNPEKYKSTNLREAILEKR